MKTTKPSNRSRTVRLGAIALLSAALMAGCGDLEIVNTNAPTADELTGSPTRDILSRAATGIFSQAYNDLGTELGYYAIYGREGYNLQGNDPRETGEQIRGPQDATGRNANLWSGMYSAIRTINTYLSAVPTTPGLTDAERRASMGFAKTIKAWHFHRLALRNGELGIPIDVDRPITEDPAPFVTFQVALEHVTALLNEAYTDLQAGGGSFPFPVGPGFTGGFSTPATFAQFNRALTAKNLVHRATFVDCGSCWNEAAQALSQSFITDAGLPGSLTLGVNYAYSAAAGEPSNPVTQPLNNEGSWVHPSIITGAQTRADGSPDLRLTTKTMDAGRTRNLNDLVATHKPVLYNNAANPALANQAAPVPWIKNEELLLLRAEIRWNTGDKPGAISDLNLVREHAGGLEDAALTASSSDDAFIDELLYNRLYSLYWSQGTRWMDARRYDRLDQLPIDRPGDTVFPNMIIPAAECVAQGATEIPCTIL